DFSFNAPTAGVADPQDVAANKGMAILSYILFFVPLLTGAHKTSPFVRFHVNQGTVLFVASLVYSIALNVIRTTISFVIPWQIWSIFNLVFSLLGLVPLVLLIFGVINAANGTLKQLPVIGGLSIIK
ncbi:MAG: hypothetical protein LBU48_07575, partial [Coriobacteriales bacterium]|nr:hypothetical protein [Coriobacteriales bacterium]